MKLKAKTKKAIRGSITVLLVIILLPMMTFSAIVVDMSRLNMAKAMVSGAGDLTMNTALANYDTILKDVYGLFAMSQDKTEADLQKDLRDYFAKTISSYGVVGEAEAGEYVDTLIGDFSEIINDANKEASNFLQMDVSEDILKFEVDKVDGSTLANPSVLRKQIVEYSKYRAPISVGLGFLDALKSFKSVEEQNKVVEAQVAAQESTQDVTKNCRKLIQLIREYDKLIKSIEDGDKTVKGSDNSTDGVKVPIWVTDQGVSPYSVQLDKYRETWGNNNNYKHINKLNMVFLANSPTLDALYLKDLSTGSAVTNYIKAEGAGLTAETSIKVNPTLDAGKDAAKQQVYKHIGDLAALDALETTYTQQDFLDTGCLDYNYTAFKDEQKAITTFVEFEQFLLDENQKIKYTEVKKALEQITILQKYYDNFCAEMDKVLQQAKQELDTATANTKTAQGKMNTPKNNIANALKSVYKISSEFYTAVSQEEDPLSCLNHTTTKATVLQFLQWEEVSMPGGSSQGTNLVPYYFVYNFGNLYNKFKQSSSDADNIYLKYYKQIISQTLEEDEDHKLAKYAQQILSSGTKKSFREYMIDQKKTIVNDELFPILECLYNCHMAVKSIPDWVEEYNTASTGYAELVNAQHEKQSAYNLLQSEKKLVTSDVKKELSSHIAFCQAYQKDLFYYGKFLQTAKSVITKEATAVNTQFVAMKDNVKSLLDQLDKIITQIGKTKTSIETYGDKVDLWEEANEGYEKANGNTSDSFSDQATADIENSRSQYNPDSLKDLKTYVETYQTYVKTFYDYIVDGTHFKYGSAKIDTLTTADQVTAAISSIKSTLPGVVTVEIADQKYDTLYSKDKTPPLETPVQMCFLEPVVLQYQILKYLNSAYPAQETQTGDQKNEESSYKNSVKEVAGGENGSSVESGKTENAGKYGYTYKDASISGTLPSAGAGDTKVENTSQFDMDVEENEDGGLDVDTETGMNEQKGVLSKVLTNITKALEAGMENMLILTYLFENFSYNTIVQDAVADDYKFVSGATPSAQLIALEGHLATAENWKAYDGKIKTLSNYPINAKNNYIYGAELEYILYGNTNAKTNVTYAKASIYAIRFGFNCIYAFTNSEIRNTTMAAGLAVQAATLGIVPYQLVQIVLQLALAAAESALDLEMMNCGLDVAIVKTTDSWALSVSGLSQTAANLATQVVNTAADKAITGAVNLVNTGIQNIVDATTDKLSGAIEDVTTNLTTATQKVVQDAVDQAFSHVISKVEKAINEMQYLVTGSDDTEQNKTFLKNAVTEKLEAAKNGLSDELDSMFAGNELAMKAKTVILQYASSMIDSVKDEAHTIIDGATGVDDVSSVLIGKITYLKQYMIEQATTAVTAVMGRMVSVVNTAVKEVEGTLQGYADQAKNLTEQEAEKLKEKVQETTNGYIDKYLNTGNDTASLGTGNQSGGKASNSIASMMKFGYKEYLMLFMFLGLCIDSTSNAILKRTADVIQLNIQHLNKDKGASYTHTKGSKFLMSEAYTYVSVKASTELDMFFVNLDFFNRLLSDDTTTVEGDLSAVATIKYKGILGY